MEQVCSTAKRKQTDDVIDDSENVQKKIKIECFTDDCYILQLPECVLTVLLSYFDASTLYSLSQTCQLFHELSKRPTFWRYIDARNPPHDPDKFVYCCKRLHENTTHFLYKGKSRIVEVLSWRFFNKVQNWSTLKVLALENQYICGNTYLLKFFPQSVEELSLRKTYVTNGFNFFRFSSCLEKLRVLILDHCQWLETSNLVSIANLKRLEILSLYMCKRLSDNDIGYLSLSGDYGLKSIKVLDIRFTGVGNQLLSSMYRSPTIQELYFQCYSTTYQLDRTKRKLELRKTAGIFYNSDVDDDDDEEENLDVNKQKMVQRFGDVTMRLYKTDVVDSGGVAMFKYVHASNIKQEKPHSFLYKYPYSECSCNHYKKFWENKTIIDHEQNNHQDGTDEESKQLKEVIQKRNRQLKAALKRRSANPMFYMVYNTKAEKSEKMAGFEWMVERAPQTEEEMKMLEHTIVEVPPDTGIIICGQTGHQYSFIGESFLMPGSTTDTTTIDKDTSDEEEIASPDEDEDDDDDDNVDKDEAQSATPPSPYLRLCYRPQNVKIESRLNSLSLRGYPGVTDSCLEYLKEINLELLDVSYTNVTARGVRNYMMVHPNCRVIHESACTCGPRMHF